MNTKDRYAVSYIREVEKAMNAKRRAQAIIYSVAMAVTVAGVTILLYKISKN